MGSTDIYRRYVEFYRVVREAVESGDAERVTEVTWNIRCQHSFDDLAVCLAIFDAVADRPMLSPAHFQRSSAASAPVEGW